MLAPLVTHTTVAPCPPPPPPACLPHCDLVQERAVPTGAGIGAAALPPGASSNLDCHIF